MDRRGQLVVAPPLHLEKLPTGDDALSVIIPEATAAGTSNVRAQITGVHPLSPIGAGDVKIYRGDLYEGAQGFDSASTTNDVTIIIGQIAAGETVPTGTRSAVAVRRDDREWIDKDSNVITETVYEFDIPRWL